MFNNPFEILVKERNLDVKIPDDTVLVESFCSGISAGTELLVYRGEIPEGMLLDPLIPEFSEIFSYPTQYGYATVGEVIDVGANVDNKWIGRRVFSFNPHESHFFTSVKDLIEIPDGIGYEDAIFLPNMETALNLIMDGSPVIGENVAVIGQGIVGLLTTSLLNSFPLDNLVTFDTIMKRRRVSLEFGASHTFGSFEEPMMNSIFDKEYKGFDLVYEVSGNPGSLNNAIDITGYNGRIIIGSWYGNKKSELSLGDSFHRSRINLITSQVSTIDPKFSGRWTKERRFSVAWDMLRAIKPSRLVTHEYPIEEAKVAYDNLHQNSDDILQVILKYDT